MEIDGMLLVAMSACVRCYMNISSNFGLVLTNAIWLEAVGIDM